MAGLTEEDRRKMGQWVKHGIGTGPEAGTQDEYHDPPPQRRPLGRAIKPVVCERIRRERDSGTSQKELAREIGVSERAVCRHANGHCECDNQSDRVTWKIGARRCNLARILADEGDSIASIARRFEVHWTTAEHHIKGRCNCEADIDPIPVGAGGSE